MSTYFCFKYFRKYKCCRKCLGGKSWFYGTGRSYRSGLVKSYASKYGGTMRMHLLEENQSDETDITDSEQQQRDIDRYNMMYEL